MKKTSCNGCIYQMEDGRPGIRAEGFKNLEYKQVKSICDECYTWTHIDSIRNNYKENHQFSKRNMDKYLKNIFEDFQIEL